MSTEYHKIQSVFLRDPDTKYKTLLRGQYTLPEFKFLRNNTWVFTEKVDGTNIRVIWNPMTRRLEYRGRTDRAEIPLKLREALRDIWDRPEVRDQLDNLPVDRDTVFYGEGYGNRIQKVGHLYRPDVSFVLFDVKIGGQYQERDNVEYLAEKFGLDIVPVIGTGTLGDLVDLCEDRFKSQWGDFEAEGIVARPQVELQTRGGKRIITKLKFRDFA